MFGRCSKRSCRVLAFSWPVAVFFLTLATVPVTQGQAQAGKGSCPLNFTTPTELKAQCDATPGNGFGAGFWWYGRNILLPTCCSIAFASLRQAMTEHTNKTGQLYLPPKDAAACISEYDSVLAGLSLIEPDAAVCRYNAVGAGDLTRLTTPCRFAYIDNLVKKVDVTSVSTNCSNVENKCLECQLQIESAATQLRIAMNDTHLNCAEALVKLAGSQLPTPSHLSALDRCWTTYLISLNVVPSAFVPPPPAPPLAPALTVSPPSPITIISQGNTSPSLGTTLIIIVGSLAGVVLAVLLIIPGLYWFLKLLTRRDRASMSANGIHMLPSSPFWYTVAQLHDSPELAALKGQQHLTSHHRGTIKLRRPRSTASDPDSFPSDSVMDSTAKFTYRMLQRATAGFSPKRLVGSGANGTVFMGVMPTGKVIAVKRIILSESNMLGIDHEEARMLARVRHPNLVRLLGYLETESEYLLISEFMPNGDLSQDLTRSGTPLSWKVRIHIAVGMARGLAFLHGWVPQPIIHGNLKPTNILLDDAFNARLADFGLSNEVTTVPGQPPGPPSQSSDVYSLGTIILQLFSGRRIIEPRGVPVSLLKLVTDMVASGADVSHLVDPRLKDFPPHAMQKVFETAYRCTQPNPKERPSMPEVASALEQAERMGQPLAAASPQDIDMDASLILREASGSLDIVKMSGQFTSGQLVSDSLRITSAPIEHPYDPDSGMLHDPSPAPPLIRPDRGGGISTARSHHHSAMSAFQHSA